MTDDQELLVRRMTWEAPGVLSLELVAPDGRDLAGFGPGAHVDLHLGKGVVRQYSLCGDPADRRSYRVAVRDVTGGLGSGTIHRQLRPGALVKVAGPRNNFPLVPAPRYLFVAGGIGITPLLPMMREATRAATPWSLLYCVRRADAAPFMHELRELRGAITLHVSEDGTRLDPFSRLGVPEPGTLLYCCGPAALMTVVEEATADWPAGSVQFEWFTPRSRPEDETSGAFQVVCAISGVTLSVPPDRSILDMLTEAGIEVPRSCEQGICGTCECQVLEGEADHRDSILSTAERAANQSMMVCVSRAKSPRLVLDL
jgi:tetrachlorobenzoquinone reductase